MHGIYIQSLLEPESLQDSSPLPVISGLPTALCRFRLGLFANQFGLGDRKATPDHSRLGSAKVPQPGVDLIHIMMAA